MVSVCWLLGYKARQRLALGEDMNRGNLRGGPSGIEGVWSHESGRESRRRSGRKSASRVRLPLNLLHGKVLVDLDLIVCWDGVCVCACLLVILVVGDECVFRGCAGMVCVCVCMSPRDSCSRR